MAIFGPKPRINPFGKMPIFVPKPWVNPFGKMLIFRLFERLVFFGLERRFFVLEYSKRIFLAYIALKKRCKNGDFWTKTIG